MAAVQAADARASFFFVGDFNGHHQEWLGSTTTNRRGVVRGSIALRSPPSHSTLLSLLLHSTQIASVTFYLVIPAAP